MHDKWEVLHNSVLLVLADLAYGEMGLRGDMHERLLREWYEKRQAGVEQSAQMIMDGQAPQAYGMAQAAHAEPGAGRG